RGCRRLRLAESLGVAHVRPDVSLDVGVGLLQMVRVVVNPLVEQVLDGQPSNRGMDAATLNLLWFQPSHARQAVTPQRFKFVEYLLGPLFAVAPRLGHTRLVPPFELRLGRGDGQADS